MPGSTLDLINLGGRVMDVQVSLWAVVLAMASSMAVGSIWYAMGVFGKEWSRLAKVDMTKNRGSVWQPIATTMIVSLITAYVLAHVAYMYNLFYGNSFLSDTLATAFWLWLGFTAARFITHDAFEGRPTKLTLINLGNELLTIMVMGLVIGVLGV